MRHALQAFGLTKQTPDLKQRVIEPVTRREALIWQLAVSREDYTAKMRQQVSAWDGQLQMAAAQQRSAGTN